LNKYDSFYKTSHQFNPQSLDILSCYAWPGNIRELEHLVERLVVTIPETYILQEHLPQKILEAQPTGSNRLRINAPGIESQPMPKECSLKETEQNLIVHLYEKLKSTYKVAKTLKISQSKVSRVIRRYSAHNN
jgi:transcriptional regulator with PAS, ATPase and Fis domain